MWAGYTIYNVNKIIINETYCVGWVHNMLPASFFLLLDAYCIRRVQYMLLSVPKRCFFL